jgi:membrane protein
LTETTEAPRTAGAAGTASAAGTGWWQRLTRWLPVRAWSRYSRLNGGTLAGGSAYFSFFAVFPAIGVGATVTGLVLQDRLDLQERLARSVNQALNTRLIKIGDGSGLVDLQQLTGGRVLLTTAVVAVAGLVFAGLGWLGAVRAGVSTMFGQRPAGINPVLAVLRDLLLLATVGAAVLATVVAGVAVTAISQGTADWLGLDGSGPAAAVLRVGGVLALVPVDVGLLLVFMRLLSGARLPVRDLTGGALVGAAGILVLRLGGGLLLGRTSSDHALAAVSSVVVGLLLWFNLLARVSLYAAAFSATVATDRGHLAELPDPVSLPVAEPGALAGVWAVAGPAAGAGVPGANGRRPGRVPTLEPVTVPPPPPSFGVRSQDRVALAAGAVIGATTLVAGRVIARSGRAAVGLLTGRRTSTDD